MKKCPYCAEKIQNEAIVCRYCGRDLPKEVITSNSTATSPINKIDFQPWHIVVGLIVLIAIWYFGFGSRKPMAIATEPPTLTTPICFPTPPALALSGTPIPNQLAVIAPTNARNILPLSRLDGHNDIVLEVVFSPDGQILASGSDDNTIRLWRVNDGSLIQILSGHESGVTDLAFSLDGQILISSSHDGSIRIWRVSDGSLLQILKGHTSNVISLEISPDGQILASGSNDNTIRLWRVSDGSLLRVIEDQVDTPLGLDFSPDGQILAEGGRSDFTIRLRQVSDGSLLKTLEWNEGNIFSVVFSPDGQTLASTSFQSPMRIWLVSDGSVLRTIGKVGFTTGLAFSPDGQTLASGFDDGSIQIQGVPDGLLYTLVGHTGSVNTLIFSPDGRTLASGSSDGTIRVWGVPEGCTMASAPNLTYPSIPGLNESTHTPEPLITEPPIANATWTHTPFIATNSPQPVFDVTITPTLDEPAISVPALKAVQKGEIQNPTTNGDLFFGEEHVYTYAVDSSSAFNYVWFALSAKNSTFDPYLIVKVNGQILGEDDDSLSGISGDFIGSARLPSAGNTYFCVNKKAPTVIFEIIVKDASGLGYGSYQLSSGLEWSRLLSDPCVAILPSP